MPWEVKETEEEGVEACPALLNDCGLPATGTRLRQATDKIKRLFKKRDMLRDYVRQIIADVNVQEDEFGYWFLPDDAVKVRNVSE
jgi:hypothetical protein